MSKSKTQHQHWRVHSRHLELVRFDILTLEHTFYCNFPYSIRLFTGKRCNGKNFQKHEQAIALLFQSLIFRCQIHEVMPIFSHFKTLWEGHRKCMGNVHFMSFFFLQIIIEQQEKIAQLESEKSLLIRELFQLKAQLKSPVAQSGFTLFSWWL